MRGAITIFVAIGFADGAMPRDPIIDKGLVDNFPAWSREANLPTKLAFGRDFDQDSGKETRSS